VSTQEAHDDLMHGHFQFLKTNDHFPISTLHKHLARNLIGLLPGIQDDVHACIDETFGPDTENWKTLNLWEAWLGIVPRVTNRVLVGEETCRSKAFTDSQVAFADTVVRNSFILNMFPKILHPVVAPLVVTPNWWLWRKSFRIIRPLIEKRQRDMAHKAAGHPAYDTWEPEECLITWLIRQAQADGCADELEPAVISKSLLPIEFAAIHTTVITGHNLILDLLSADPKENILGVLKEEVSRVFAAEKTGFWTKAGLSRLHRVDSAIRESMRLSHFATALTHRKVIAKDGITNTQEGWHAPYGSYLMLDLAGTHHDSEIYPEPNKFDPLRFSREREEFEARPQEEKDPEEALRVKRLGMVTTSDTYLPFSHGRHAW
jgi:cytochrome P450